MPAYVIVEIKVIDAKQYEEYRQLAPGTIAQHGGRYVVRGGAVDVLEGDWAPTRLVVLEFENADGARAWWNSDEYREPKQMRQRCAKTKMILVDGI